MVIPPIHVMAEAGDDTWKSLNTQIQSIHEDTVHKEKQKITERNTISQWQTLHTHHESIPKVTVQKGNIRSITKHSRKPRKGRKTMSETVRDAFAKDKVGYFASQSKIDDFIHNLSSDTLSKSQTDGLRGQAKGLLPGNVLFTRDEWIHIVKQTRLRFPELHRKGKQTLKHVTSQMQLVRSVASTQYSEEDHLDLNSNPAVVNSVKSTGMWSQASTCPDEELTPGELRWLYDLPETMISDSDLVSFADHSQENDFPYLCTLSQAMQIPLRQEIEDEVILDSEPEPDLLRWEDVNIESFNPLTSFRFADTLPGDKAFKDNSGGERLVKDSFIGDRQVKDSFIGERQLKEGYIGDIIVKNSFIGERIIKDSFIGEPLVKDSFIGEPQIKDSFNGKSPRSLFLNLNGVGPGSPSAINSIIESGTERNSSLTKSEPFKTPTKKSVAVVVPGSVTSTVYSTAVSTMTTPRSGQGIDQILGILDQDSSSEASDNEEMPSSFSEAVLHRADKKPKLERKSYRIVTVRTPLKVRDYEDQTAHIKVRNVGIEPGSLQNQGTVDADSSEEIQDSEDEEGDISVIEITRQLEPATGVVQVPSSTHTSPTKPHSSPLVYPGIYSSVYSDNM